MVSAAVGGGLALIAVAVTPVGIGDRLSTVGGAFQRFRVKRVRFYFKSSLPTTQSGNLVLAVADDVEQSGTTPSTADQLMNLRRRAEGKAYSNISVAWSPLDRSKWYYTANDTANDARFESPGTFLMLSDIGGLGTSVTLGSLYCDYEVEFAGRTLISI